MPSQPQLIRVAVFVDGAVVGENEGSLSVEHGDNPCTDHRHSSCCALSSCVYCLMRDKPPDLILSSLLKKIYILPLTEVVTLNLRDMLLTEETAKIPVASNPADKSFICAKHHDFNDNVGDDVWQRGNNNGFSSWEDE